VPLPPSIPHVVEVSVHRGAAAGPDLDLLIEIPHGATQTADYDHYAAQLGSPLPPDLVDFFHVNTDAGAPELATATAAALVAADPRRAVAIVRCRVPRTFIDCNRQIDASPEDFRAGKVGPGLMPWIATDDDRALLRAAFDGYVATVAAARAALAADGAMVMLHTYAPRTVDVQVDHDIVASLRAAYAPDRVDTWPLRPALDVIATTPDGVDHAPTAVVATLRGAGRGPGPRGRRRRDLPAPPVDPGPRPRLGPPRPDPVPRGPPRSAGCAVVALRRDGDRPGPGRAPGRTAGDRDRRLVVSRGRRPDRAIDRRKPPRRGRGRSRWSDIVQGS
jgi:hypothetical protein